MAPPRKVDSIHWQTYEYDPKDRSADWFWAVGIITVAVAVTSIILNNVLFAIVIILGGFALSLYASRPPRYIDIVLDEAGIRIDRYYYPYRALESFWVEENETKTQILLKSQRLIMPYIIISVDTEEVSADTARRYLSKYLPEVFHSESIFEKFLEKLGF